MDDPFNEYGLLDELDKKDEIIQSLEKQIIELLDENRQIKLILDRLKKKKLRGESINDITGNLKDIIQSNLKTTVIFDILYNFNNENLYKFLNLILIGEKKNNVPIAIYDDYFAYKENNSLKFLPFEKLPKIICNIYKPIIKNEIDKKIQQHENDEDDISILEDIYKLGNNAQLLFNNNMNCKKIIKNYQS